MSQLSFNLFYTYLEEVPNKRWQVYNYIEESIGLPKVLNERK